MVRNDIPWVRGVPGGLGRDPIFSQISKSPWDSGDGDGENFSLENVVKLK